MNYNKMLISFFLFCQAVWSRFFPAYDKLREELAKKTIGDIKYVSASLGLNVIEHMKHKELGGK